MTRHTLKQLKNMAEFGIAEDISRLSEEALNELLKEVNSFEVIAVSLGKYGMNGALLKGYKAGRFFVITARNSNLFRLV